VELLISVVLIIACFYQLAENAPYSRVKVFCHFRFSLSTEHPTLTLLLTPLKAQRAAMVRNREQRNRLI
jgi:hypothetical protein